MLEEQANKKEKLLKYNSGTADDDNLVNHYFIEAIEAKLAILDDIKD